MNSRIIVTGGIGSGKTTLTSKLEELGAFVVHADEIGHLVLEPEGRAYQSVTQRWPEAVDNGRIDRRRLAKIVFEDPGELRALEALTHPVIREHIEGLIAGREGLVVVEVPLITDFLGPGWTRVVVDAPEELRRQRAIDRGMDPGDVDARMAAQPSQLEWLAAADIVVDNSSDEDHLEEEARRLMTVLRT